MSQIINWICLMCISLLVMEVMVYFCKDVIKTLNSTERIKSKNVVKARVVTNEYIYETKIAK